MSKLSLHDIVIKDKKVLMRVDFNVPLNEDGTISDDTRIKATIPSIEYILNQGGSLILISHLGRPKKGGEPHLSLKICAEKLSKLLKKPVVFISDVLGENVKNALSEMTNGDIILLENLRFYKAEEHPETDPSFAKQIASYGDIYVNDAFGCSHRKHSSIFKIPTYFEGKAASGFLLDKETAFLNTIVQQPKRPFYAILGGSKISTKIGVIKNLIEKIDALFLGGGMAFTFLKAQGIKIGDSVYEEAFLEEAKEIIKKSQEKAVKLWLPIDFVISCKEEVKTVNSKDGIPDGWAGMDIGEKTIKEWEEGLKTASTVFWNGPVGVFEKETFSKGTNELAKTLSNLSATTIIGGGDSLAAIQKLHLHEKFTHISTGGGATLEYLEFGHLPGIDALSER